MADEVAKALAKLNKRKNHTTDDDLVFCGVQGGHLAGTSSATATRPL